MNGERWVDRLVWIELGATFNMLNIGFVTLQLL